MKNRSVFYFTKVKMWSVMAYLELYFSEEYFTPDQEEWEKIKTALDLLSLMEDDKRNAQAFYGLLDENLESKQLIKELCPQGKYAVFEDDRKYNMENMDNIQLALFDFYTSNFS